MEENKKTMTALKLKLKILEEEFIASELHYDIVALRGKLMNKLDQTIELKKKLEINFDQDEGLLNEIEMLEGEFMGSGLHYETEVLDEEFIASGGTAEGNRENSKSL